MRLPNNGDKHEMETRMDNKRRKNPKIVEM